MRRCPHFGCTPYQPWLLGWLQREAAAEQALKEAEEKRKRDEEAAEQARLVAERTAALQVQNLSHEH